jgi:hypothetical protein
MEMSALPRSDGLSNQLSAASVVFHEGVLTFFSTVANVTGVLVHSGVLVEAG